MSNEFDLERAKAGEPIEYRSAGNRWIAAYFVGPAIDGSPTIQLGREPFSCDESEVRMAYPKTAKVRYRVCVLESISGKLYPVVSKDEEEAKVVGNSLGFKGWVTDWQEVEVPQ